MNLRLFGPTFDKKFPTRKISFYSRRNIREYLAARRCLARGTFTKLAKLSSVTSQERRPQTQVRTFGDWKTIETSCTMLHDLADKVGSCSEDNFWNQSFILRFEQSSVTDTFRVWRLYLTKFSAIWSRPCNLDGNRRHSFRRRFLAFGTTLQSVDSSIETLWLMKLSKSDTKLPSSTTIYFRTFFCLGSYDPCAPRVSR